MGAVRKGEHTESQMKEVLVVGRQRFGQANGVQSLGDRLLEMDEAETVGLLREGQAGKVSEAGFCSLSHDSKRILLFKAAGIAKE